MKTKFFLLPITLFLLITCSCSCSTLKKIRPTPIYNGVDEQVKPYVDEFLDLSKQNNITFSKKVTIGMTTIDSGNIIGICHYGFNFREIDIDTIFFAGATEIRRKALIFHELVHCYCGRSHDFGENKPYPIETTKLIVETSQNTIPWCLVKIPPGYLDDGCASTIMHPVIQEQECLEKHWDYYLKEMFDRCDPF